MFMEIEDVKPDNPQSDLVAEARELLASAAHGPLTLIRYEGSGRLYREEPRDLIADFYCAGDREFYARSRDLVSSLANELEQERSDSAELGERLIKSADRNGQLILELEEVRSQHSVQAETIMEFQEEQRALMEALRSVPLLLEAAKGILNVHTWRGSKGYESALSDGIRELQAAVKNVPDVAGMLLTLNSTPKGEQQ